MRSTTRADVEEALGGAPPDEPGSTHVGLFLDRFSPVKIEGDDAGRCGAKEGDEFVRRLEALRAPAIYPGAFERWERSLGAARAKTARVRAFERVVVGHGNPSGLEVGLTLHPTYGVPCLPGTALKGLLNHYMATWAVLEPDGAEWRGVEYTKDGPAKPPGAFHGALFGAPEIPAQEAPGRRGLVSFEDALYVPGSVRDDRVLLADVVTPHQKDYYRAFGTQGGPNEWDEPIPVGFLSVRPGAEFLVAVTGRGASAEAEAAAELALGHLLDALETWGIGAKTRAGYGRLERVTGRGRPLGEEAAPEPSGPGALARFRAALTTLEDPKAKASKVELFNRQFASDALVDALSVEDRREALTAFEAVIARAPSRLRSECAARIEAVTKSLRGAK